MTELKAELVKNGAQLVIKAINGSPLQFRLGACSFCALNSCEQMPEEGVARSGQKIENEAFVKEKAKCLQENQ